VNSEELEHSLRTEFESYLNNVRAEMRQEVYDFQEKFQTEFEKHKSHLDEIFRDFSARLENEKPIDEPFKESVVEHLRLARDEGARVTASAIAEAEDLQREADAAEQEKPVSYIDLRDAINDITSQDSQSGILKSLVNQAAQFTPRGAFFIIKNEYFVGWRVFGAEAEIDEQRVREIYFPVSAQTILGESVRSLSPVESGYGTFSGDDFYLNKLEFGQPEGMYAIPLIARGRGVAVLYADIGENNGSVSIEALETLVRIAGLTVELLASSQGARMSAAPTRRVYQAPSRAQPTAAPTPKPQTVASALEPVESESEAAQAYEVNSSFEQASSADNYSPASQNGYDFTPLQNQYTSSTDGENQASRSSEYQSGGEYQLGMGYKADNQYQSNNDYQTDTDYQTEAGAYQISDDYVAQTPQIGAREDFYSSDDSDKDTEETKYEYSWNQPEDSADSNAAAPENTETSKSFETVPENSYSQTDASYSQPNAPYSFNDFSTPTKNDFEFASSQSFDVAAPTSYEEPSRVEETPRFDAPQFDAPRADQWQTNDFQTPQYNAPENFSSQNYEAQSNRPAEGYAPAAEPASELSAVTQSVKTRLSERNVDLPIEVAEEERRLHNDARRFARLLVSEIKLYNEQKVREGRESGDLYERLREAIDRSREMYNKRVQPPVAAKFDYFHYELVSNLAEGDENSLGNGYPGAEV
jgi:hypothetical protein